MFRLLNRPQCLLILDWTAEDQSYRRRWVSTYVNYHIIMYIYRTDRANVDKYGLLLPMVSAIKWEKKQEKKNKKKIQKTYNYVFITVWYVFKN